MSASAHPASGRSEAATVPAIERPLPPLIVTPEPQPTQPSIGATSVAWPLWQRIAFRYALLHALLYMAPRPLSNLVITTAALGRRLDQRDDVDWPWLTASVQWLMQRPAAWLGELEQWWQAATSWCSAHGLVPVEVIHQPTGSGDTGHDYARLFLIVIGSVVLTALWSALDRRPIGYPRLGRWLHLGARWYLAFWLLVYGGIKLYAGQFPEPGLARLSNEIGDTSPMGMVWTFLGASKPYEVFGGIGELAGGLLLFHRRTALFGCLVTIAVMTNVCALNWLYDVPVKLFSTHLLLFAVALLAPWGPRLWALLVSNRSSQSVDMNVTRMAWLRFVLAVFGWCWVLGTLLDMHLNNMQVMVARAERMHRPALFGRWDVEKMIVDGEEVPVSDASRWQFFAIDQGDRAFFRAAGGQRSYWQYAEDLANGQITLSTKSPVPSEHVWRVELGKKIVSVANPEPRTREDFAGSIEAERRTLVLAGEWQGKQLELQTVEHVYLLHRGFHWVQEMPFNR